MKTITIAQIQSEILETAMVATSTTLGDFESLQDLTDLLESIDTDSSDDFEIELPAGTVRVIHSDSIDKIQQDELKSDLYALGCFNASFLAGVLNMDQDVIESMQQSEAFEAVGKLVMSLGKLEELQSEYSSSDGYGHHFAHYDHEEHEAGYYLIFRTN